MEHDGIAGIIESGQAPSFKGRRKPGGLKKPVFDAPTPLNDVLYTARLMETNGQMTPETAAIIKKKIEGMKAKPEPRSVDYQITGHPAEKPMPTGE
jgi:hypothetical protein